MVKKMRTMSIQIKIIIELKIIKSIKIKIKNIINRMHRTSKINIIEMIKTTKYLEKLRKAQNLERLEIKFNPKIFNKRMRIKKMTLKFFKSKEAIEIKNKTFKILTPITRVDQTPKIINKMFKHTETIKNCKNFNQIINFINQKAKTYNKK